MANRNYPKWTQLDRIVQYGESAVFKEFFCNWYDKDATRTIKPKTIGNSAHALQPSPSPLIAASAEEHEDFKPHQIHEIQHCGGRAPFFRPDSGDGTVEQYRIEKQALIRCNPKQIGVLYTADTYVIKYCFRDARRVPNAMIYVWQGKQSSVEERSTSVILALAERRKINKYALLVRISQCHEPRHFLKIWKGTLIVMLYGRSAGFHDLRDPKTYDSTGCRLFRVRGATGMDVRAEQRPAYGFSLASDDAFVLESAQCTWLWHGRGASEVEKLGAREVAARLTPQHGCSSSAFINDAKALTQVIQEAAEPDEFWKALTGRLPYDTTLGPVVSALSTKASATAAAAAAAAAALNSNPRMIRCWSSGGILHAEEVRRFEQSDLQPTDVMLLDGGDELYVWVGSRAPEETERRALSMAVVSLIRLF